MRHIWPRLVIRSLCHDTRTALNEEAKASGLPPGSMTGPGSRAPAVGSGFVSGDEAP